MKTDIKWFDPVTGDQKRVRQSGKALAAHNIAERVLLLFRDNGMEDCAAQLMDDLLEFTTGSRNG